LPGHVAALRATLAGCALSAAIETAQRFIPGRVPVVQDVVVNTIGAAIGAAVAAVVLVRRARAPA
jgi:VanZ family protein